MRLRPARLYAVARRDLAIATAGRGGLALIGLFALLLAPIALIPSSRYERGVETTTTATTAAPAANFVGDVPPELDRLPGVHAPSALVTAFRRDEAGVLHVHGRYVPQAAREILDAGDPAAVPFLSVFPDLRIPGRAFFIALLTASILAGSVSEALPGERSRKTLETMLTAAITRGELVVGKWAAWTGVAAVAMALAVALAMLLGRSAPGLWLLPLPLVPGCTIALGLWLVRRSSDVVGGATVSVRVLPALLSASGIVAWVIGTQNPWLGAAVPLGGALLATGETWDGVVPPLIATTSTGLATAGLLAATTRDLETDASGREAIVGDRRAAATITALTAGAWWTCLLGPLLWGLAGNAHMTSGLAGSAGITGASLMTLALVITVAIAAKDPAETLLLRPVRATSIGMMLLVGFLAATTANASALLPISAIPDLVDARARTAAALCPTEPGLLILSILAQELVFRGAIHKRVGPVGAALASAVVLCPLDPVRGLIVGALFAALVRATGSSAAAIGAHLAWAGLAVMCTPFSPMLAVGAALAGLAVISAFPADELRA